MRYEGRTGRKGGGGVGNQDRRRPATVMVKGNMGRESTAKGGVVQGGRGGGEG